MHSFSYNDKNLSHVQQLSIYQIFRIQFFVFSAPNNKKLLYKIMIFWCPEFFFFLLKFAFFSPENSCPKYHIWGQTENTDSQRTESMIEPEAGLLLFPHIRIVLASIIPGNIFFFGGRGDKLILLEFYSYCSSYW